MQPGEKAFQRGRILAEAVAFAVFPVEGSALTIFFGNFLLVKCPDVLEKLWDLFGRIRQLAFKRVVINKYEAVEAQLEFGSEFPKILRFRPPVHTRSDNVFAFERHLFPAVENFINVVFIVFAAEA